MFLSIPEERRHLITPYEYCPEKADDDVVRVFNRKPIRGDLNLVTQSGEHVRSKSELIIAERLGAAGVPYYYEDPLIMEEDGKGDGPLKECLYWHPDFRVQNVRTGRQYYWEHFGMMDNPEYCASAQFKIETYAKHQIILGKNLIVTTESSQHSLNVEYVDRLIKEFL